MGRKASSKKGQGDANERGPLGDGARLWELSDEGQGPCLDFVS